MTFDNTVSITVGGQTLSGFQKVRVTRGIERVPSDFEFTITEKFPGQSDVIIKPDQACVVKFGSDTVLTGLVDAYSPTISATDHSVVIRGVSNFSYLTRASATQQRPSGWPSNHDFSNATLGAAMYNQTVNQVAKALASPWPFIAVTGVTSNTPIPILQFNIGDTPFAIIERACRWAQLLVFDDGNGNIVFAQVGQNKMSSGFQEGSNIQVEAVTLDYSQRFSDYIVVWTTTDSLRDEQQTGTAEPNNVHGYAQDTELASLGIYKPKFIVSEQTMNGVDIGNQLAVWNCNRSYGRSQAIRITCDSWRDSSGALWAPNSIATVNAPTCKINNVNWIIAEVSYLLDESSGTTAELTLMPPQAFAIEPLSLSPTDWDTVAALGQAQQEQNDSTLHYSDVRLTPQ